MLYVASLLGQDEAHHGPETCELKWQVIFPSSLHSIYDSGAGSGQPQSTLPFGREDCKTHCSIWSVTESRFFIAFSSTSGSFFLFFFLLFSLVQYEVNVKEHALLERYMAFSAHFLLQNINFQIISFNPIAVSSSVCFRLILWASNHAHCSVREMI